MRKIHGSYLSQPTRMVIWTAKLMNTSFEFQKTDTAAGEHRSETFLKLNPNSLIPVLVEGDFVLYESNAISRYLCGESSSLYPKDPKVRALVDQWLDWKHGSLRRGCAGIVRRRAMRYIMKDISKHSMSIDFKEIPEERDARQLMESLQILEETLGKTQNFVVKGTSSPTLADLALFEEVEQLRMLPSTEVPPFGSKIGEKFPNVANWQAKMRKVDKYDEVHKDLNAAIVVLEKRRKEQSAKL